MNAVEHPGIGERILSAANIILLGLVTIIFFLPMWHCLMASFSDPSSLIGYRGLVLKPLGFSLEGYRVVLKNKNIFIGYANTLFYVIVGTALNMVLTILGAYVLSRKRMLLKKPLTLLLVFTMYVDFGMVPAFLNVRDLGLYNNRLALILPGAVATYNLIVLRTAFESVPSSLEDSALVDGASDWDILWHILLPLSKASLAVICLFYAVGHWNSWFEASIYLQDRGKFPLQLYLREILLANSTSTMAGSNSVEGALYLEEVIKYSSIVVSTVPILVIYPFLQKYFVKGVMLGAVKE